MKKKEILAWLKAYSNVKLLADSASITIGIGMGIAFLYALPFPVQVILMVFYLLIGSLGWLPWQREKF